MKVGDLVTDAYQGHQKFSIGIVIRVIDHVEIPPVVEVLWDQGNLSKTYQDELQVIKDDRQTA